MVTKNFTKLLFLFVLSISSISVFGQSISGTVNASKSAKKLGYANVDIYKNGKLVANVLTDYNGNFTVKLDTGTYQCEINYAGYEKYTKEIKVTTDEKADFAMKTDEKSKYAVVTDSSSSATGGVVSISASGASSVSAEEDRMEEVAISPAKKAKFSYRKSASYDYAYSPAHSDVRVFDSSDGDASPTTGWSYGSDASVGSVAAGGSSAKNLWEAEIKGDSSVHANFGKLTAGEINDFSKWNLWTDLTAGELKSNEQFWNFSPTTRYTVQLKDQNGLPLANANVELLDGVKVIYNSRSDNTGKAELWGSLKPDSLKKPEASSIKVTYNGEIKNINHVKKFENGINFLVFNTECVQPQNVDIAMVVDATGSMQDEINYLKEDLNNVIFKSKEFSTKLNLRFANVFYRDHEDAYLTQSQDFTRVLSESVAFTSAHSADGGGDTPEAVEVALDSAINHLSWGTDTRAKILFLVLDASPHNTPEIREKMIELCKQAAAKGIRIVPIAGSGITKDTEYLMRCLALATNGTYVFTSDHSGIGNSHIAPSTDSYQVEILNDLLVRVIKSFTYMPDCQQTVADLGVNLPTSQVYVTTFIDTTKIDSANTKIVGNPAVANPESIKDTTKLEWKYYPNPTNGIVNIVTNKKIEELYITDLSGKVLQVVKNISPDEVATVDLSEYSSGLYLIRYPMEKQFVSGKIMLSR